MYLFTGFQGQILVRLQYIVGEVAYLIEVDSLKLNHDTFMLLYY